MGTLPHHPRELTISGERLLQNPVAELKTQRGASTHFSDTTTRTFGHVYEAYVTFTPGETSSTYGINMRTSESEQTVLTYEMATKQLTLDRTFQAKYLQRVKAPPGHSTLLNIAIPFTYSWTTPP